jgi:hypothetical protein
MYLNFPPVGVRSRTPTPTPCFHEEPLKKRVQWGPVKTGGMASGSLSFGPPRWHGGGIQATTKLTSTWLLNEWYGTKSSSSSTNFTVHLAMLPATLGLWSTTLSGYDDTTEILQACK